jgi:hypothetical protein
MTGRCDGRAMKPVSSLLALAVGVLATTGVAACGSASSSSSGSKATVDPSTAEVNPAGDIPDDQVYVPYRPPGGGYSVKVPEGWARTGRGGAVTFTDKLNRIRMESAAARGPLSPAAAKQSTVPQLASSVKGFQLGGVTTVSRTAGKATLVKYLGESRPDPVTGRTVTDAVERYAFFHRGRSVVLTLSGPKGADNVDPWQIVTDSLRYTR